MRRRVVKIRLFERNCENIIIIIIIIIIIMVLRAPGGASALTRRRNGNGGGRRAQKVERRVRNIAQNGKDEDDGANDDG